MGPALRPVAPLAAILLRAVLVLVLVTGHSDARHHHADDDDAERPWTLASAGDNATTAATSRSPRTRRVAVYDAPPSSLLDDKDDVLLAALQRARAGLGSVRPPMHKVLLTQIGYIQFLRYAVPVPELAELTVCVWLRSRNLTHNHPIFSYSRNEKERLVRAWVSPAVDGHGLGPRMPPRLHLSVLERPVFVEPLAEAAQRRWLHVCASWEGRSGQYRLYVDGKLRRAGVRPEVSGLTLPAGGDVVVGQEYTDFDKGLDDGVEGEVFGFHLFRTATPRAAPPEAAEPPHHDLDDDLQRQHLWRRRGADDDADDALWRRPPSPWRRSGDAGPAVAKRPKRQYSRPRWPGPGRYAAPPKDYSRVVPTRVQRLYAACTERLAPEDQAEAVIAWPSTSVRVFGGAMISNVQGACGDF